MHLFPQAAFFQQGHIHFPHRAQFPPQDWMAAKLCAIIGCPRQTADVWIDFLVQSDFISLNKEVNQPVLHEPTDDMSFAHLVADTLLRLVSGGAKSFKIVKVIHKIDLCDSV